MSDLQHGTSAADPLSLLAAIMLLALIAPLATIIPAWRASRAQPIVSLQYE